MNRNVCEQKQEQPQEQMHEQTRALLELLAMGKRDIEQGCVYDADSVFAEFDAMDETLGEASHA